MSVIASFDVFGTLLTRSVGEAEAIDLLLGRRLESRGAIQCSAEVFARQRRRADERARDQLAGDALPPGLVHAELARGLLLPPESAAELLEQERALRFELSRLVPGAQRRVEAARARGEQVVFVADADLPESDLRWLLDRHGLFRPGDRCRLRNAQQPQERLNRYEEILERYRYETGGLTSVMAGASRAARLSQEFDTPRERALAEVSAGVVAPTLTAWMVGVLERARREGVACLYFLARDGEILLDVARRVERWLQTGLELRYLRASRITVLPAAADESSRFETFNLDRDFRSVRTVLASIGLKPEEAAAFLPATLREPARWDIGCRGREATLLGQLTSDPGIRRLAIEHGRRSRELLVAYLRQEGWDRPEPIGIVDVGWRGRIVRALDDVCRAEGLQSPRRVYFFGVRHDAHQVVGDALAPALDGWFYDHAARTGLVRHMKDLEACVEMFCAAEEGSVVDYERDGSRIRPVLGPARSALASWGLRTVRGAVATFADQIVLDPELVDPTADTRAAVNAVLEAFWTAPTPDEVDAWAAFPLTIDMFHSRTVRMAEPIRLRRVVRSARRGRVQLRPDMSWPTGTTRVSALPYRLILAGRDVLRRELPRARRRRTTATTGASPVTRTLERLTDRFRR